MNQQVVVPPRAASTIVLLRDTDRGPEALMVKRHGLSDVLGDSYVFPGGKVDKADVELDAAAFLDEPHAVLHARLAEEHGDQRTAAGLFVAAIREACEESGILMAHGATEWLCSMVASELRKGSSFNEVLADFEVRLCASQLVPLSRWITPIIQVQPKRFDTRFFVARAPLGALASHDGFETTEVLWMRPRQAL
jgi:8-oxo-dGTP pyrophosphatase MutT (NUDIX family)